MKEWCDTLLSHKINTSSPYTNGALICPACHVLHGRVADLCFPLSVIWDKTGDEKYLSEADELINWSEYNLGTGDGLWYNDITNRWYATSAFSALSIGESLFHFGDKLPLCYKEKWMKIFVRMADTFTTLDTREDFKPVTNYYCGSAALLAMAWRLTGDEKYLEKSKYWLNTALSRFDEDGLLYGEGYPMDAPDGSHTIDMGYDLEESLPLLLRYSSLTGEYSDLFRETLRKHLDFLLPNGAIDNSFGVRLNKWTYWGSRTSDGIIEGLALVLDDPTFATACERALTLYEKCTHNGLLAMPMAHEFGEPTCIHHTFTHAKALAALVCSKNAISTQKEALPCEEEYGVKQYQNGKLILVSRGGFRATFSASLGGYISKSTANAGASMNLLYHKNAGVICAATTPIYSPTEPLNQQYLRNSADPPCMTAQFTVNGEMCCLDKSAKLSAFGTKIVAEGKLWRAEYDFTDTELIIDLCCNGGMYSLPVVCSKNQNASLSVDGKSLTLDNGITIVSSEKLTVNENERTFHQVGGLGYLPISVSVQNTAKLIIKYHNTKTV